MASLDLQTLTGAGQFQVSSFRNLIETSNVCTVRLSHDNRFVALLYSNGQVHIIDLSATEDGAVQVDTQESAVGISWVQDKGGAPHLVSISKVGHLQLYSVSSTPATPESTTVVTRCLCQCHVNTLRSLLRDAGLSTEAQSAARLLPGPPSVVVLQAADFIVTLEWRRSQPPLVESVIRVDGSYNSINRQLVLSDNPEHNTDIWDLERGVKVATVQLSEFVNTAPDLTVLTDSFNYLVSLTPDNKLHVIDLNLYFLNQTFPHKGRDSESSLTDTHRQSVSHESNTSHSMSTFGKKWQQKLSRMNRSQTQPPAWYHCAGVRMHGGSHRVVFPAHTPPGVSKKKRVPSGFSRKQTTMTSQTSFSVDVSFVIDLDLEGLEVDLGSVTSSGNKVAFQCHAEDDERYYHVVDLDNGDHSKTSLPSDGLVVPSQCPTFPPLFVTQTELFILTADLPQEQLVSRLMLYDSAGVADTLCRNNGWDRCTLPLHALEVGLRHRQLDTVAFFLKSRENIFVSHDSNPLVPRTPSTGSSSPSLPKPGDLDLDQVEPAIQLLVTTVQENVTDNQSKQFAEQLLHLTLDFLHKVTFNINEQLTKVRQASRSEPAFEEEVKVALAKVMRYISELRQLVPGSQWMTSRREVQHHPLGGATRTASGGGRKFGRLTTRQQELLKKWRKMSDAEVVTEGILSGEISLLQLHLRASHGAQDASLAAVVEFGLKRALECLHHKQLPRATQIFSNLGFDVRTKLRQVCLYTPDRPLRDYLIEALTADGNLTPHELQMVNFIQHLESLYSCQSFELAKLLRRESPHRNLEAAGLDLSALMSPNKSSLFREQLGEVAASDVVNSETASYSHLVLEWAQGWDDAQRQAIQLDQLISRNDASLTESISSGVVWRYLVARRDTQRLMRWIDEAYPSPESVAGTQPAVWPYTLRITPHMLSAVNDCDPYTRHELLDHLALRGVLSPQEAADTELLVARLARSASVIADPHHLDRSSGGVLLTDLHRHMVALCIKHQLPELLYFYLDYWHLCRDATDLMEVGLDVEQLDPWVSTLLHVRSIARDVSDTDRIYEASLAASLLVQPSLKGDVTVGKLLDEGLVGRALTTLVYKPEQLHQMVSPPDGKQGAMPSIAHWQTSLSHFPRLQTALCRHLVDGIGDQDINMYHLLQEDAPFDVTHLFGWQNTNSLYCGDSFKKMPHMACPELASQFGLQIQLHFTHYLHQARPSFAFCALIISLLNVGNKTLSAHRLKSVVRQAQALALRSFARGPVAAATVAFLEMLGSNTTVLRVQLQAARLVRDHQVAEAAGSAEQRHTVEGQLEKSIAWLLAGCMKRRKHCLQDLLALLEDAVRWQIDRLSLKSSSPETLSLWQLVVMFCCAHHLPPSTGYLADCAKANDWLMFLTFAQIHNFDKDLVHAELGNFSQRALHEHLHYVIENVSMVSMATDEQRPGDVSMPPRDVRAQLYSRIGLTRPQEKVDGSSSENMTSEDETQHAAMQEEEEETSPAEESFCLPHDPAEDDVFAILLACDVMPKPSRCLAVYAVRFRNPVLAVLAACYQDNSTVGCLCSWLVASTPDPAYSAMIDSFDPCDLRMWTVDDVRKIILMLTKHCLFKTILTGLLIFCPDALLVMIARFCVAFSQHEDPEVCRQFLETFKTHHSAMIRRSQPDPSEVVIDETFTVEWTESVVHDVLTQSLSTMTSVHDLGRLLRLLDQTNVTRLFSCQVPDFSKLYRLHQMISPSGLTLNYYNLTLTSGPQYEHTCRWALDALQEKNMYNEARVFAEVAGVSSEIITIRQMESELEQLARSAIWRDADARCTFWRKCHDAFSRHQVSLQTASSFFQAKITSCTSHRERGLVCQLAYDWLEVDDQPANQKLKKDLFVQIWMCKIHDHMEREEVASDGSCDWLVNDHQGVLPSAPAQRGELLQYGHIPSEVDALRVNLSQQERSALETLIGQLLDKGKVKDACQVAALIGHYSQDLTIVITCLRLALGHMTPDELNMSIRRLITAPSQRLSRRLSYASSASLPLLSRRFSTASFTTAPVTSLLPAADDSDVTEDSVIGMLQLLTAHVTRGQYCCQRIVTIYQISQVLGTTFEWTVLQEEFVILQALLNSDHAARFPLAKAFLTYSGLGSSQVAGFLGDTIMKLLNAHHDIVDSGSVGGSELVVEADKSCSVTELIMSLIQLCDDTAMLGQHLHDNMTSLTSSNHEMSPKLLSVCVELLVASHHCYTLACSMQGIAAVLRSARRLTELLAQADEFSLLIRLLTGVGRFSEMTYIFDILKQQHQLELLFRKGMDKEEGLRMAILDYIQRVHPSDTDTNKMVSLYFTMYREIAAMLEETAQRQLATLHNKPLDMNSDVPSVLQSVVHYFSDAAESYVKENCLRHAQRCVRHARLGALQLHLLSSGQRVVNLSKAEVGAFISNHPKFWEAHIVADAYEDHSHWPAALCRRYVIGNDVKYLTDLRRHVTLTASLIADVTDKYKCESQRPTWAGAQMKKLLALCPDVLVTYRAAQDLGFTDYSHELLKGDHNAYLRDSIGIKY